MPDLDAIAAAIDVELRAAATPERAAKEKRYLKSAIEHYGTSVPQMRRVVLGTLRGYPPLAHDDVIALADLLWAVPVHERRMAAVELLTARVGVLTTADLVAVERLIREAHTWALVDPLAASVAGVVAMHDQRGASTLDRWEKDDDFWVRRASLLALLPGVRRGEPDLDRLDRYCDDLLDEKEFFIRKAIGWLLREQARRDPADVVAFLEPRLARTSGVTFREAVRPLDVATRERLTAARSLARVG